MMGGKRKRRRKFVSDMEDLTRSVRAFSSALRRAAPRAPLRFAIAFGSSPQSAIDVHLVTVQFDPPGASPYPRKTDAKKLRSLCARKIVRHLVQAAVEGSDLSTLCRMHILCRAPPGLVVPGFTPKLRLTLRAPQRVKRVRRLLERYQKQAEKEPSAAVQASRTRMATFCKRRDQAKQKCAELVVPSVCHTKVMRFSSQAVASKLEDAASLSVLPFDSGDGDVWYLARSRPKGFE